MTESARSGVLSVGNVQMGDDGIGAFPGRSTPRMCAATFHLVARQRILEVSSRARLCAWLFPVESHELT